jgi:outer membrane protein assembly factor BamB
MRKRFTLLFVGSLVIGHAANWPTWRGPEANGIASEKNLPVVWSADKNVRWRVALEEPGNSTPIIWGGRIFLTQNRGDERTVICLDRDDGKILWQKGIAVTEKERTHDTNPFASASPVTDGERVIAWLGSAGLVAYDFSGEELWRADLGRHDHVFGYGGSPVLHGQLCFLNFGPGNREFLVAVDKKSGQEKWRHSSPVPPADDIYGTWSTPFIVESNGRVELLSALRGEFASHDPATGKLNWWVGDFGTQAKSSPIAGEGVALISGDKDSAELAVKLGGSGDVTKSHVLWRKSPPKRRVGTGVIHGGYIYGAQTGGLADCVELKTGKVMWEERLKGPNANTAIWTSPILADGRLYIMNQGGDVFVLGATPEKFEILATNSLGERSNSSMAVSDGRLFLRTHKALWCVGE